MVSTPSAQIPARFAAALADHGDSVVRDAFADPEIHAAAAIETAGRQIGSARYFVRLLRDLAGDPERVQRILRGGGDRRAPGAPGRQGCKAEQRDDLDRWEHPLVLVGHTDPELLGTFDRWDRHRQLEVLVDAVEAFELLGRSDDRTGALDRWTCVRRRDPDTGRVVRLEHFERQGPDGRIVRVPVGVPVFERAGDPARDNAVVTEWIDAIRRNAVLLQDFADHLARSVDRARRNVAAASA